MDEKQKFLFDASIRQAEYFYRKFDGRRQFEWKVTLGVWTLLVGGIAFLKKPSSVPWWVTCLFVFGYVFLWLKRIWEANGLDKDRAHFYQKQADCVMRDPSHLPTCPPWQKGRRWYDLSFLSDWSMQFQAIATAVLAILFYLVQR